MTKEEYEVAILSKYKEAKNALEILNDSELKSAVFSKCSTAIQLILLKANTLLDGLLVYFKEEIEKTGVLFI